jgi:taurine-pyruvate aminotransferase
MNGNESSEVLISKAKKHLWPHFGHDATFFDGPMSIIRSAEGRTVTDILGNRYLESNSCGTANVLGFNLPEILEAIHEQINRIGNTTPNAFAPTEPLVLLAEKIASFYPGKLTHTLFSSNGTDANETALKIARQYWKIIGKGTKYKTISRYPRGYHGMSLNTLSASGHSFRRTAFEPLVAGFIHIHAPVCYRCPFNLCYSSCGLLCAQELRQVIEYEDPSTIACFIGEQTFGGGGIIPPPPGYMKLIREICNEYEILLILDEVVTGFGKTGTWFECEKYDIVPDMITMGKCLSWGTGPLSGTRVKSEIAEVFVGKNVMQHGYTFGGMGYLAAAGLAGIDYVQKHRLLERASDIGVKMTIELEQIKENSKVVGDVRVNGVLAGVELVQDKPSKKMFDNRSAVSELVEKLGRENGVILNCFASYGNIINLCIPLTMTDDEMAMVVKAIGKAVAGVEERLL